MESNLVLRAIDLEQPVTEFAQLGAIPAEMMLTSWQAMERIRAIATRLPDYPSGTNPERGDLNMKLDGMKQPWVIRWQPDGRLRLHISVDATHNRGHPIDRDHDLPKFNANGKTLTDQREMRQGWVKTVEQHLTELRTRYPEVDILAHVGNANLLANYGFVAWLGRGLYHLTDEPVFKRPYTCIVSWKDGHLSVEDLWFAGENGSIIVLRRMNSTVQDITDEVDFATSGQPSVRKSEALALEQIADQWYDARHLIQPLRIAVNGTALFVPNAQLQLGLLRKALCQPVHVRVEAEVDEETTFPLMASGWLQMAKENPTALAQVAIFLNEHGVLQGQENVEEPSVLLRVVETTERLLENALRGAGYRLVDNSHPLNEGEGRFINGHLEIFFKKALYPHNVFVCWSDGSCGFVIFPGKSGREGTTLPHA